MKDFAGSSITYYGLVREKLRNKYPRLISILVVLSLICMTGLAIFLISDIASFAYYPDHKGVLASLAINGFENGIESMTNGKEKSGNTGANSSQGLENISRQNKEHNPANLSQMRASPPSAQAAKNVATASKSSSSSTGNSVDEMGGKSPTRHHSSSSLSSSSSSSSAKSIKKSNDINNLTNISLNSSQRSNDTVVAPTAIPAFLPSLAIGGITNKAKDASARVPETIITFKTDKQMKHDDATYAKQESKVTASGQANKVQEARARLIANKNQRAEGLKKKAAQLRAKR